MLKLETTIQKLNFDHFYITNFIKEIIMNTSLEIWTSIRKDYVGFFEKYNLEQLNKIYQLHYDYFYRDLCH